MVSLTGPVLLFGAALLALWTFTRFPRLEPKSWGVMGAHLVASNGAVLVVPVAVRVLPLDVALVAVILPVLTYILLAALWMMRMLQGALAGRFR
jgi:hypothetical protein